MEFEEQKKLDEKNEKIGNLLMRIKKINGVYNNKNTTEEHCGRLLEHYNFIVD
jgi:hypothetical protein